MIRAAYPIIRLDSRLGDDRTGSDAVRSRQSVAEGVLIRLGVVAGDGVGPEVMAESLEVLGDRQPARRSRVRAGALRPGRRALPADRRCPSRRRDRAGCAAATPFCWVPSVIPELPPGILEKGILLRLRFDFHQYVNLRPIQLYPGVECPIRGKGPDDVDMVVVRENNEDLYVGAGGFTRKGTPEEVAIQTSINTRAGVERTIRYRVRPGAAPRHWLAHFEGSPAKIAAGASRDRSLWSPRPTS